MEKDDRCYCNDTGSCPYCNENYFKDFHNLLVYPTFDGGALRPGQGHRQGAGAATGPAGHRRPGHPGGDEETL